MERDANTIKAQSQPHHHAIGDWWSNGAGRQIRVHLPGQI